MSGALVAMAGSPLASGDGIENKVAFLAAFVADVLPFHRVGL